MYWDSFDHQRLLDEQDPIPISVTTPQVVQCYSANNSEAIELLLNSKGYRLLCADRRMFQELNLKHGWAGNGRLQKHFAGPGWGMSVVLPQGLYLGCTGYFPLGACLILGQGTPKKQGMD